VNAILVILYACFVIGVTFFLMLLVARFVSAHERAARALEQIAQNQGPRKVN